MHTQPLIVEEVPLRALHFHHNHTDVSFDPDESEMDRWLLESLAGLGLLCCLIVSPMIEDGYIIVDGRRRYLAAKHLGLDTLSCRKLPRLSEGDFEILRFMLHDTLKPLTQAEMAAAQKKLRQG